MPSRPSSARSICNLATAIVTTIALSSKTAGGSKTFLVLAWAYPTSGPLGVITTQVARPHPAVLTETLASPITCGPRCVTISWGIGFGFIGR